MDKTAPTRRFLTPDSKHFWENVFLTPLYWLFLYFFQPVRFSEQFEYRTITRRFTLVARLVIPLFLSIFIVALPVQGLLLCTDSCTVPSIFTWHTLSAIFPATLLGVVCGLLISALDNVGLGIILSFALGVTGIVFGNVDSGEARSLAVAIAFGLVTGTAKGLRWRMWYTIPASIFAGLSWFIASISVTSITESTTQSVVVACAFFGSYMVGYYRVLLYLVSGPSGLHAYITSKRKPTSVFLNLHKSSLYWDECVFLPLPLLRHTLLIAVRQNVEQALHEIAFIAKQRPQQIHAAQMAAIEIALRDLQSRETVRDIAPASQRLHEIFPEEMMLKGSGSITPFTHLIAVSLEAERYTGPFNWQTKHEALETMRLILDKIYPDTAFSEAQLNTLLADIIIKWRNAIRYQQEKLEQGGEGIGQIVNPYNPGNPLKPHDTLFVGRRDVVRQLSESLSKPNRPTFLLNGERRMGKSSTLRQLPHLLGASYIPILYDLQVRSTTSSVEALLTKIADEIHKAVRLRGIHIEPIESSYLQDALQKNEAAAYQPFDEWLNAVEHVLQRENLTLLLLFDEFEKLEEAQKAGYLDLNLLLDWFRNTIQNRSHVALLFSGVNTFGEMDENWASYFVNAKTFRISFLKSAEARDLITKPVPNFPAQQIFVANIVEEIIRVTGCHPFLVQAVCSELIDNLNYENHEHVELPDVAHAIAHVLENWGDTYFRDLWIRTDQQQRTCLTLLSQQGTSDVSGLATVSGLDEQAIRQTLYILRKRDLVLQEQNSYRIAAPILNLWIVRNC